MDTRGLPVVKVKRLTFFEPMERGPEAVFVPSASVDLGQDGMQALLGPFCRHCFRNRDGHLMNQPVRKSGTTKIEFLDNVCEPPAPKPWWDPATARWRQR